MRTGDLSSLQKYRSLIWLDETGSDRRNSIRAYGYVFRGLTPIRHTLRVGGKRISAIGVMTTGGIKDAYIVEGGVNGDVFENFVRRSLLPILQPFNGSNPCSVVMHQYTANGGHNHWSWCSH